MLNIFGSLTTEAGNRVDTFVETIDFGPMAVLDLLIVGGILYWLYTILRETRALGIIYGILVLVLFFILSKVLRLELLALLISNALTLLFVAIPVLFQPELRRALERLGRTGRGLRGVRRPEYKDTVAKVSEAARVMSQNSTGALIVFRRTTGLADISTTGTAMDAKVSTPLVLNLFYDKSPLHDGAVIIDNDRIVAAGVMLPLSEKEYGYQLGARHRAAVGLTEQCDAVVRVVSEEKGIISLVVGGKITPGINPEVLPQLLEGFLSRKAPAEILKGIGKKAVPRKPGKDINQRG